jgi:ATP-dependent DNA helicase DinG
MKASERLSPSVVSKLKAEIEDAEGNEVFCAGHRDESLVAEIVIAARGGRDAVPALVPYLERGDVVIHNHPSGVLKASGPDLAIASFLGNQGIGFYIVDNEVERIYVCAEPVEKKRLVRMDGDELAAIISPGGALSRLSDSYECRASQVDMLREVARAFNDDGICVAEAGTGVGKSFAYLIPACVWAMKNDERVVVSTGTINLQQQLLDKDIPFVKKLLKSTIKTVLVKGRGNYLCLRRLEDALAESGLFLEEDKDLGAVADWAKITSDGSKTDLPFMPENGLWSRVNSEADFCLGIRCSRRDECFVLKARREAASAKVLVVNHHLLFSDLALRIRGAGFENSAVLPPFQRIIFDEAHNMESSATSFFSESLNKFVVLKILSRLYAVKRGRAFGVIVRLEALSGDKRGLKDIPSLIEDVRDRMLKLDQSALAFTSESFTYRLKGRADDEVRSGLLAPIGEFQAAALRLIERLSGILEGLDDEAGENIDAFEARILTGRLSRAAALCESFTRYEEDPDHIFWLERQASGRGESFAELSITPLSVAGIMEEAVFTPLKTVVCTSATLSVKDRDRKSTRLNSSHT